MRKRMTKAITAALTAALLFPALASAVWPVASGSSYISRYYSSYHKAVDIAAPRWTRVVPMKSGRTVFAGWRNNCGGYQVWVGHGDGLYSAYYHLARETSWGGELVTGGSETIGYVGTTGCATGSHVHVEVWRGYPWRSGSYRVNPWNWIDSGAYLPSRYR